MGSEIGVSMLRTLRQEYDFVVGVVVVVVVVVVALALYLFSMPLFHYTDFKGRSHFTLKFSSSTVVFQINSEKDWVVH